MPENQSGKEKEKVSWSRWNETQNIEYWKKGEGQK